MRWGGAEAQEDPSKFQAADLQIVLPGYFEAMGTTLLAGRTFTRRRRSPDRNLLIVDQALAAKAFPNESAVGKRILFRVRTPEAQWGEIIGVVAHQRNTSLVEPGREQLYVTDGYVNHGLLPGGRCEPMAIRRHLPVPCVKWSTSLGKETFINQMQPMDSLVTDGSGADTLFAVADRSFLDDRSAARGCGFIWRARYFGSPANRGDRRAHGPRRRAVAHLPFDGRKRTPSAYSVSRSVCSLRLH